jgi:hypothetical protein
MSGGIARCPTRSFLAAAVGAWLAASCGRGEPPPQAPVTTPSSTPITVTGSERIAWDQAASSASQLAHWRYIGVLDDVPIDLADATCATTRGEHGTFVCSARLPKMSPGLHRLQLVAAEIDGERRQGSKSGQLVLNVVPSQTSP